MDNRKYFAVDWKQDSTAECCRDGVLLQLLTPSNLYSMNGIHTCKLRLFVLLEESA